MRAAVAVTVIATALLAAMFVSSPLHLPLNNPNEGVRVFTVKALVEQHTFAIDDVVGEWGYIDDKAIKDGHLFQSKAPFVSLVAAAAYAVVHVVTGPLDRVNLTRLSRVAGGVVPFVVCLGIAWWALRQRRREHDDDNDDLLNDLVVVAFVVGSGVLASLHVFSGHALAAVAPFVVIALSRLPSPPTTRRLLVVSAALAAATCAEYPAALSWPLAWLVVRQATQRGRAIAIVVVTAAVTALPTMIAHTAMFGAPWRTGYSFLESAEYKPLVAGAFFGIELPHPDVLGTVLFSPEIGLFFGSPLLAFGLLGIWRRRRLGLDTRTDTVVVVVVIAAFMWFIAGFRGWRGGWSVGPRYILEVVGLLSAFVVDGLRVLPRRLRHITAFALVAVGVVHSGLAGAFFPHLPDVLRFPIGELLLPLIARGFAPDSVPLWLGVSSSTAAAVIVVVVVASVVVVGVVHRSVAVVGVVVIVPLAIFEINAAPVSPRAAMETRRITDNWRPERGNPYFADLVTAPEATAYAIDRGRLLRRQPLRCADATRPARDDVGPVKDVLPAALRQVTPHQLVVVDDALADHIGPAGGPGLTMTIADLRARGTLPLPCRSEVFVVVGRTTLPTALSTLREASPTQNIGNGFRLLRLHRSTP